MCRSLVTTKVMTSVPLTKVRVRAVPGLPPPEWLEMSSRSGVSYRLGALFTFGVHTLG